MPFLFFATMLEPTADPLYFACMATPQYHRAFVVSAVWTLALLLLGSVVHATGSSLACPDWPTCYGTMVPAMEGGVFWEHLHRLVAGGLILMWLLAGWLAKNGGAAAPVLRGWAAGLALLIVQAVFGGVTVLLRLPAAVSTTHLALAFLFLALAVGLAVATSPRRAEAAAFPADLTAVLRGWGTPTAALVFAQSLLGGLVRHVEAGMACPDLPLCLGQVVPPLDQPLVVVHYAHRVVAVVTGVVVVAAALAMLRYATGGVRRLALAAIALVLAQITLGVLSVAGRLAVVPVSLHTLGAALLFATWVALAAWGRVPTERAAGAAGRAPVVVG
jgi:heme A synthase